MVHLKSDSKLAFDPQPLQKLQAKFSAERFVHLIGLLLTELDERKTQASALLKQDTLSLEQAGHLAHNLLGSVAHVGCSELQALSEKLRQTTKTNEPAHARKLLCDIIEAIELVTEQINCHFSHADE